MARPAFVYIMASQLNGTLYTGLTTDLAGRVFTHREGLVAGFTKRYGCSRLVWFESHEDLAQAQLRERQIKEWRRCWKLELIEQANPEWDDLYPTICA